MTGSAVPNGPALTSRVRGYLTGRRPVVIGIKSRILLLRDERAKKKKGMKGSAVARVVDILSLQQMIDGQR